MLSSKSSCDHRAPVSFPFWPFLMCGVCYPNPGAPMHPGMFIFVSLRQCSSHLLLSASTAVCSIPWYTTLRKTGKIVCTWCRCWCALLFFSVGVVDSFFCTHVFVIYSGYCFFYLVPTHPSWKALRWRASLHTEMLVVGGCWCWWDQLAHAQSDAPSKPLTHQLTPIYP